MNKLLLIAYKYPPASGVGGRRWAKFSRKLAEKGWIIHVVTAKFSLKYNISNWLDETKHKNIRVCQVKGGVNPNIILGNRRNIFERFVGKCINFYIQKFSGWIDHAEGWLSYAKKEAVKVIKNENIKHVIATGPPFSVLYLASCIKEENPTIKLTLDLRDPWIEDEVNRKHGVNISHKMYKKNLDMEIFSLHQADHVTTVSNTLLHMLKETTLQENSNKFHFLSNGFDSQDYPLIKKEMKFEKIRFVYCGYLWGKRLEAIKLLYDAFINILSEDTDSLDRVELYFVGASPPYNRILNKYIKHFKVIPQNQLYKILNKCDIGIN
ncbi:MAG: hypothetical protein OXB84_08325, partial [Halobacteriovoraceae bacterium]|nr:hypothetical protein [Halobacteriovoraceae bacterium]